MSVSNKQVNRIGMHTLVGKNIARFLQNQYLKIENATVKAFKMQKLF